MGVESRCQCWVSSSVTLQVNYLRQTFYWTLSHWFVQGSRPESFKTSPTQRFWTWIDIPSFLLGAGELNSGFYAYVASTLLAELSLQSWNSLLKTSVTVDKHIGRQCPQHTCSVRVLPKWSVQLSSAFQSPIFLFMDQHWVLECLLNLIMPSVYQGARKSSSPLKEKSQSYSLCSPLWSLAPNGHLPCFP